MQGDDGGWLNLSALTEEERRAGGGGETGARARVRKEKMLKKASFGGGGSNLFIWTAQLPIYAWIHILSFSLLLLLKKSRQSSNICQALLLKMKQCRKK